MRTSTLIVLALSLTGCAAVFRGTKEHVRIESTPAGAAAKLGERPAGATPVETDVPRKGLTQVTLTKPGYEEHRGLVRKRINPPWLLIDIGTCVFTLCVPLVIDAVTGAWLDVDKIYTVTMRPGLGPATVASASPASSASSAPTTSPPSGPPPEMSESERKAIARAAYLEGVKLQEQGHCPEALPRLEAAQKFYSAPTHLLHIGQCQAATGKLLEASETYETLVRVGLTKDSPEAFRRAQDDGKKELAALKPRVPTLKIQTLPAPSALSGLVVKVNGNTLPNEVLGLARPVNPGHYKVTVWAAGYKEGTSEVDVAEGAPRSLELRLSK